MRSGTWAELLAQAILHTLVASIVIEALVRSWRVAEPGQRMVLRALALVHPLLVLPAYFALFPVRREEAFRAGVALYQGSAWGSVRLLGVGLDVAALALFAALGLALFLMDLVPLLRGGRRPRPAPDPIDPASAAALEAALGPVAARAGLAPAVIFLARDAPVLFVTGVRAPALVVSRGTIRLLDAEELRAAVAHEVSHLAGRDPLTSWLLMAGRALMCLNPAFQVVSRAISHDAERRADDRAARLGGDRLALASALLELHRATSAPAPVRRTLPFAAALSEPLDRAHHRAVERRCRRLLDPAPAPAPFGAARVALAGLSLTALLFFVV